ncbi:hypothetical protein AALA58_07305 [Lactococcus ileimucosae]|uniref:Uncharacterized protein n=1 Tax=Lactococcus ileimucosae TaxID=2941329 RepID=A0ABV4D099_9LACT
MRKKKEREERLSKELFETYMLETQDFLEVYKEEAERGTFSKDSLTALSSTFRFYKQLIFFKMEISFKLL